MTYCYQFLQSTVATGEDEPMVSPKRPKLSPSPDHNELRGKMDEEEGEITEEEEEDILLLNDPLDKLS